jgi:hypothetical protein
MSTLAGDFGGVFVIFAIGAAVFLVGHAGTGGVGAFLEVSHDVLSPPILGVRSLRFDARLSIRREMIRPICREGQDRFIFSACGNPLCFSFLLSLSALSHLHRGPGPMAR